MTPRTRLQAAPRLAQESPGPAFRVLFVRIGHVCGSPLGERLPVSKRRRGGFQVSSAGIGALERIAARLDQEVAGR